MPASFLRGRSLKLHRVLAQKTVLSEYSKYADFSRDIHLALTPELKCQINFF